MINTMKERHGYHRAYIENDKVIVISYFINRIEKNRIHLYFGSGKHEGKSVWRHYSEKTFNEEFSETRLGALIKFLTKKKKENELIEKQIKQIKTYVYNNSKKNRDYLRQGNN